MKLISSTMFRRLVVAGCLATAGAVLAMAAGDLFVRHGAEGHVYAVADVPAAPVALVLGSEVYADGSPSPFLAARLEIARQLYADGKVRAILVSGDHREWDYNEPGMMFRWLLAHGVPTERIVLDHAGFDTYDSCARAKEIFGADTLTVVTQSYHIDRAVTICRELGIDANGVGDDTVRTYHNAWYNSEARERGAVVKALFDVVSRRDPVFLGPYETGVDQAVAS
ncbi:vancomycin high temperature exclusion protein [Actinoplanes sp. NPDC051494]|uniref:vancomycin high temperature exclusion protein n=1 Tax=Actinoplanes sp. NPDC051494 TaxID=3363907 RepID=UPI003792F2BF